MKNSVQQCRKKCSGLLQISHLIQCHKHPEKLKLWLGSCVFASLVICVKTENIQHSLLLSKEPAHDWYIMNSSVFPFIVQALAVGSVCLSASTAHEAGGHQAQQAHVCWLCHGYQSLRATSANFLFLGLVFVYFSMRHHSDAQLNHKCTIT